MDVAACCRDEKGGRGWADLLGDLLLMACRTKRYSGTSGSHSASVVPTTRARAPVMVACSEHRISSHSSLISQNCGCIMAEMQSEQRPSVCSTAHLDSSKLHPGCYQHGDHVGVGDPLGHKVRGRVLLHPLQHSSPLC